MLNTATIATPVARQQLVTPLVLAPLRSAYGQSSFTDAFAFTSQPIGAARVLELLGCDVRGTAEIDHYLGSDGALLRVVLSAMTRLRRHFPERAAFRCEVTADPEGDAPGVFVLSLRTSLSPQDAMPRLDAFDETWWLDASRASNGRIVVAIEYL